jgi:hypothetical protein
MDTIYRYLDSKLVKTRQKAYTYLTLLTIAVVSFTIAITIGSILSNYLAKPFYIFYLKPVLTGFNNVELLGNTLNEYLLKNIDFYSYYDILKEVTVENVENRINKIFTGENYVLSVIK